MSSRHTHKLTQRASLMNPQMQAEQMTQSSLTRYLELFFRSWIFLAAMVLLVVWALPHTIAARNIALYTGLVASLGWASVVRPQVSWRAFWPSICLLLVPLWVLFHWYFISTLRDEQWQELNSTWLRASAAVVLGSILGLIIASRPKQIIWIFLAISLLPTITFFLYLQQVYLQQNWILPGGMFYGPFKGKFSEVYFVLCQVLVGFALLSFVFERVERLEIWPLIFGLSLILMGIADFIGARALNGILITVLGMALSLLVFIIRNLFNPHHSIIGHGKLIALSVLILAILTASLHSFWAYDQTHEGKLANLIGDIKIASQIDQNKSWVRDGGGMSDPVRDAGRSVNHSTYERISWFIKGVRLIQENPLGNGLSHRAFGYYMRAQFPGSVASMTHSAWVDFALGVGLPGLLLVWGAIFGVAWRGFRRSNKSLISRSPKVSNVNNHSFIQLIAIWLILGLFCLWIIGEVSEREYLEHYFFLVALFGGALTVFIPKDLKLGFE